MRFRGSSDGKESAYNAGDRVQSLGREDPLEKRMATHSSLIAWRIQWAEEPGGLQSMGSHRGGHDRETNTFTFRHVYLRNTCLYLDIYAWPVYDSKQLSVCPVNLSNSPPMDSIILELQKTSSANIPGELQKILSCLPPFTVGVPQDSTKNIWTPEPLLFSEKVGIHSG